MSCQHLYTVASAHASILISPTSFQHPHHAKISPTASSVNTHANLSSCLKLYPNLQAQLERKHNMGKIPQQARKVTLPNQTTEKATSTAPEPEPTDPSANIP